MTDDQRDRISTWMLVDEEHNASYFPQAGRLLSADPRVQEIYWRCVAVFFSLLRRVCKDEFVLRLYTNVPPDLHDAGPAVQRLLSNLQVEVVQLSFTFNPPEGYYGAFRNQFYIFDILEKIAAESFNGSDLVLDSDCICVRSPTELFGAIRREGALTLSAGIGLEQKINGLTRREMQEIFSDLGCPTTEQPEYLGGEFYGATAAMTRRFASLARPAFEECVRRFHAGKIKFNEEAHLLSYLYHVTGVSMFTADLYMRTVWTGLHFRNGTEEDTQRPLLHLPTEKRFGFPKLYDLIQDRSSWFHREPYSEAWIARVHRVMSVPRPAPAKLIQEASMYAWARARRVFT